MLCTKRGQANKDTNTQEAADMCTPASMGFTWVGVKHFGFTEEQKNIEQGSIKLKELHVCIMCVQKKMAAWRSKCRKVPESNICVCRKAKVVELHIVCMLK